MHYLYHLIEQYGLIIVFANVLAGQLGAPVPTYPTLVITGALAYRGEYPLVLLLLVAVLAALLADYSWYLAGRRYGRASCQRCVVFRCRRIPVCVRRNRFMHAGVRVRCCWPSLFPALLPLLVRW